jgi:hypothetical protein
LLSEADVVVPAFDDILVLLLVEEEAAGSLIMNGGLTPPSYSLVLYLESGAT